MRHANLALHKILRPANPHRTSWDEEAMQELTASIRQLGVIQPIIVKDIAGGYEIIAGDRRTEAARRAGLTKIPVLITEPADLVNGEAITWAENLNRDDLAPMDQARQVAKMRDLGQLDTATIARIVNRSAQWVQLRLAMIELPQDLVTAIENKTLAVAAAMVLAKVTDAKHREYLTTYTVNSGANVAVVRDWVLAWVQQSLIGPPTDDVLPPMPINGEPYIVLVPCWLCHEPRDHNQMLIQRVCRPCAVRMQEAINAADTEAKPTAPEDPCQPPSISTAPANT